MFVYIIHFSESCTKSVVNNMSKLIKITLITGSISAILDYVRLNLARFHDLKNEYRIKIIKWGININKRGDII